MLEPLPKALEPGHHHERGRFALAKGDFLADHEPGALLRKSGAFQSLLASCNQIAALGIEHAGENLAVWQEDAGSRHALASGKSLKEFLCGGPVAIAKRLADALADDPGNRLGMIHGSLTRARELHVAEKPDGQCQGADHRDQHRAEQLAP